MMVLIGQKRENSTDFVQVGSGNNSDIKLTSIVFCNTTNEDANVSVCVTNKGDTSVDESTAIFWDYTIAGGATVDWQGQVALNNSNAKVYFKNSVNNAITITVSGEK